MFLQNYFPNWEPFIRFLWPKFSEHEKLFMHLSENDAKIDILKLVLKFEKASAIGKKQLVLQLMLQVKTAVKVYLSQNNGIWVLIYFLKLLQKKCLVHH